MTTFVSGIRGVEKCRERGNHADCKCCTYKKPFKAERALYFGEGKWLLTFMEAWRKWEVLGSISTQRLIR